MKRYFKIYTADCAEDEPVFRGVCSTVEDIDTYYNRAIKEQVARFVIQDNLGGVHLNRTF